jgi:predicted dehydrogenase
MTNQTTRRQVIKTGSAAGALAAVSFPHIAKAQAGNNDTIKIGLIGCGGRGSGAIVQALKADTNTKLWAIADAFQQPVERCLKSIASFEDRSKVPSERQFVGMDSFKEVIASGVDIVILTTPPGFRPQHIAAAVEAGLHMFVEKPMAVDPAGLRSVLESVKKAKAKGLTIQNGFCWRYHPGTLEAYTRINAGEFGAVNSVYGTYLAGPVRPLSNDAKKPEGMGGVEWQVANWINFDWLSGGPLMEQAIHTTDKIAWAMGDAIPVAAVGTGGKIARTDPGNVYDHYNVTYEYANSVFCHLGQRQIQGVHTETIDRVNCEGAVVVGPGRCFAKDKTGKLIWRSKAEAGVEQDMYQVEHNQLFKSLRAGKVINGGDHMINSTAHAMLGALAAQTGKRLTWDDLWNSDLDLAPDGLKYEDDFKHAPVPVPGVFKI